VSDDATSPDEPTGAIAWMVKNTVASNLLMFGILACGVFLGLLQVKQEVFPEISLDLVNARVVYPGASPDEVEQGIVLAIEEEVRGIDGVKSVDATAGEGFGSVTVELLLGADPDKAAADVKNAVDRITTFPEDAEEPSVSLLSPRRRVISLFIAGDQPLTTLQDIAEDARRELIAGGGVTYVEVKGVPENEVAIEVDRATLERYGLTLDEIAQRVRASSLELPAGGIDTTSGEVLVKLDDRRRRGFEFEDIVVRGTAGGGVLTLGDIATVRDTFEENDQATYLDGRRAVEIVAYRVGTETPQSVADYVKQYAATLDAGLPDNLDVRLLKDDSEILVQRIELLVKNAAQGLMLVLFILYLFLNIRLAFWVALGIPISFLGAFALMPTFDITVNMISLFAFIITLGLVVDDAIVLGENIYEKMEQGLDAQRAAIEGAQEMAVPVTFAILTTIAAFSPMFFVPGVSGKIFRILPSIALAVLVFSLIESFFILPAHLGHETTAEAFVRTKMRWLDAPSRWFASGLAWFNRTVYEPVLRRIVQLRYIAAATAFAVFVGTLGIVGGGFIPFVPFPILEGNTVTASVRLPYGTPVQRTEEVRRTLEASARRALEAQSEEGLLEAIIARVGEGPSSQDGPVAASAPTGSHLLAIELELIGSENRETTATAIEEAWSSETPPIAGLESLTFNANIGPAGDADLEVQLVHADQEVLIAASRDLTEVLQNYTDLIGVQNSYAAGKPQFSYSLTDAATTLGLTGNDVGRQLRAAFFGAEALRDQRGRNEVEVRVRLPPEERSSLYDLEQLRIRTPAGGFVPLEQVATLSREQAPTDILRDNGNRVVNVKAYLAPGVASNQAVVKDLDAKVFDRLRKDYPGLRIGYGGQQAELGESLRVLGLYFVIALVVIYALLAIPFRSYTQPLLIMFGAIPMGIVGAIWGHLLLGYELSMVSMFGVVALSGVVINDSLVLIDAANTKRRDEPDTDAFDAILYAGTRRLRPILLTSLTTFFGLMPLIFEKSVQAVFIIPMAISLGVGILFATAVILLIIPSLYLILEDVLHTAGRFASWLLGGGDEAVPPAQGEATPAGK
jgi:multidrug efflux pump subunit AcrB